MKNRIDSGYLSPEKLREMILGGFFDVAQLESLGTPKACFSCSQRIADKGLEVSRISDFDGALEKYFIHNSCYSSIVN